MRSFRQGSPALRMLCIVAGCIVLACGVAVAPLPGPGGVFFFIGGLALILPNSPWAMRRFARLKRRWPRVNALVDRMMRRPSARRRAEIAKARAGEGD